MHYDNDNIKWVVFASQFHAPVRYCTQILELMVDIISYYYAKYIKNLSLYTYLGSIVILQAYLYQVTCYVHGSYISTLWY